METTRRYDIDWLRVIAIALLVVYHIAIVFQPWALFIGFLKSDETWDGLWTAMSMLNVWRIPFLFYVSGMGVFFAMQKRNVKELLWDRAKRIGLPYVFGILAIVPIQFFIFQKHYGQTPSYFAHPAHLWFLGNIAIYISLLFPLFYYLVRKPENAFRKGLNRIMANPFGPLLLMLPFLLEVLLVQPDIFSLYAQTLHGYAIGFVAFISGFILVYSGEKFWQTVGRAKALYLGLAISLYALRITIFAEAPSNYLMVIESNLWILGLFGLGYRYLNKPSAALRYLSQMAYPVYIIHMFVLFGVAHFILPLEIHVALKFTVIVLLSLAVCYLIFEFIIRRINFLRPFFGLKTKPKELKQKEVDGIVAAKIP